MANIDFQNGFIAGLTANGIAEITNAFPEAKDVVADAEGNLILTDKDGKITKMKPTYDKNGVLTALDYNGKSIPIEYDENGDLKNIGSVTTDVKNLPYEKSPLLENTVTFKVDGNPYEIVSVKNGNSVNAPATVPPKVTSWENNGIKQVFPFMPTEDVELNGIKQSLADKIYEKNNISKEQFPYLYINYRLQGEQNGVLDIRVCQTLTKFSDSQIKCGEINYFISGNSYGVSVSNLNPNDSEAVVNEILKYSLERSAVDKVYRLDNTIISYANTEDLFSGVYKWYSI